MDKVYLAFREAGIVDAESPTTWSSDDEPPRMTAETARPSNVTPKKRRRSMSPKSKENMAEARAQAKRERGGLMTPKAEKAAQLKKSLSVGIDLGHTFIGVAYMTAGRDQSNVIMMTDWKDGERMEKAPTRIAYAKENPGLEEDVCGYEVRPGMKSHQLFKLSLDHSPANSIYDDPLLQSEDTEARGFTGSAFEKMRDVLKYVRKFIFDHLEAKVGVKTLEETPIRFFITTPAMWSLEARAETRRAAEEAGFGDRSTTMGIADELRIIDEPESAIISVVKAATEQLPGNHAFKEGQVLTVADLGGGTSDLGSYGIIGLKRLELGEMCVGIGAKVGGTSIDRALYKMMGEWFGESFTSLDKIKTSAGSDFMKEFEDNKRHLNPEKTTRIYRLPLKMDGLNQRDPKIADRYDFEDCKVQLSFSDMEKLFKTAIQNSWGLVLQQMELMEQNEKRLADGIVLAGGLGSSRYVSYKFRALAKGKWGSKVQIIQPLNPWSAICRGAALQGHQGDQILSRHCRASYGFVATLNFVASKHLPSERVVDAAGNAKAKNQMIWTFKKGEKMKVGASRLRGCTYVLPADKTDFMITESLYQYDGDDAPSRLNKDVYKVGIITMDLTNHLRYKRSQAKKKKIPASRPIRLEVDFSFSISGDKGVIEVSALVGKKPAGTAKMTWEPTSNWTGGDGDGDGDAEGSRPRKRQIKREPRLFFEANGDEMDKED